MQLLVGAFPNALRPRIHCVRSDGRLGRSALLCKAPLCLDLCSIPHPQLQLQAADPPSFDMTDAVAVADIIGCRCRLGSLSVQPTQWCSWSFGGILGISYRQRRERIASARHAPKPQPSCGAEFHAMCHAKAKKEVFCCSVEYGASGKPPWLCVSCLSCLHSYSTKPMHPADDDWWVASHACARCG